MRRLVLLLALAAAPALAQTRPTETEARAFVARQEAAWNGGKLERYFAGFTPDATFTDQAYVGDKPPVPYGTSTLKQARAFARKAFANKPWPSETGRVLRIEAAGGETRVISAVGSTVWERGRARRLCATRAQTLVSREGKVRTVRQIDTFVKCRG